MSEPELKIIVPARGPSPSPLLLVGEAPGAEEERLRQPFIGTSGEELDRMLSESGIPRDNIRVTNVCQIRPPFNEIERFFISKKEAKKLGMEPHFGRYPGKEISLGLQALYAEIETTKPRVIIALGETALWALTGNQGITNWRGSLCRYIYNKDIIVIPTYHPAAILRNWSWRTTALHDLRYAARNLQSPVSRPPWNFKIRPSYQDFHEWSGQLFNRLDNSKEPITLAADIETSRGMITCIGFATSKTDAFCVPFTSQSRRGDYWIGYELENVVMRLRGILTHPNAGIIWHNGLYDLQYIYRWLGIIANVRDDTMLMQHTAWLELPKSLDFIASLYCDYRLYWKEDRKDWDATKESEDTLWTYNCTDVVRTFECYEVLRDLLIKRGDYYIHHKETLALYEPVLFMMLRGVHVNEDYRTKLGIELFDALNLRLLALKEILGHAFNPRSPQQVKSLLYEDLKLKPIINRKTRKPTTGKEAIAAIKEKYTFLVPFINLIEECRSIGVYKSTFVDAPLDIDKRLRCSYNIGGTVTTRFSSSENAFGSGTNLENIPRPDELKGKLQMPNIRRLFVPDPSPVSSAIRVILDADLERADAQVVAWDADDEELKKLFRSGADIHAENAKVAKCSRQIAKSVVHGTNYGGSAQAIAKVVGLSTKQVEAVQNAWFEAHPAIKRWHERVWEDLMTKREIKTAFGRRRIFFDRIAPTLLKDALAWIGQTTVAEATNRGLRKIYTSLPNIEILLQNHDSLVMQLLAGEDEDEFAFNLHKLKETMQVVVPYPDPLIIPIGIKLSTHSWGDCREVALYKARLKKYSDIGFVTRAAA
jgi:DNA polymerase